MYIYKNSFHGTTFESHKTPEELDAIACRFGYGTETVNDRKFVNKIRKALCGSLTCKCGGLFGIR